MRPQSATVGTGLEPSPDTQAIQSHLERVLGSPEFAASPRLARFLAFVVETALAGKSEQIKESLVAVEVYGRRPDYNPQVDSTVRVEAGRLRARLRQYYEASGRQEGVRIELPKGAYVPVFRHFQPPAAPQKARFPLSPALAIAASLVAGAILLLEWRSDRGRAIDSIAVLPFVNLSEERAAARIAERVTEELTMFLARDGVVRVAARSRIGKADGVRAVLEGSIRTDGDKVVVTAQLVDTRTGYHLWANRYEHNAGPRVPSEVARSIVSQLRNVVQGDVRKAFDADPKTLAIYHRACDLLRIPVLKNGPPGKLPDTVVEAVRLFRAVTVQSPGFAKGWAGLAEAAEWEYEVRGNQPPERLAEARAAAERAVELAPDLVEGWMVLTSIRFFREWDFEGAEAACLRAIELDPRNTSARQRYVDILRVQGRMDEARFEIGQAIELQPAAAPLRMRRALMLYEEGRYDEALREAGAAAELTNQTPAYPMALWVQGLCLEQKGRAAEAEKIFRNALVYLPHDPRSEPALGHLLARTRRPAEAETILSELQTQLTRGRMTHAAQALVYTGLGRRDEALDALERGLTAKDDSVPFAALDPRFRPLHSDPRFRAVLEKLSVTAQAKRGAGRLKTAAAG